MSDEFDPGPGTDSGLPRDELDRLLRQWHDTSAERAARGREPLLTGLRTTRESSAATSAGPELRGTPNGQCPGRAVARRPARSTAGLTIQLLKGIIMNRYTPAAASVALLVVLATLFLPAGTRAVQAKEIMLPDGGRLEAFDDAGQLIGPCPLEHTDVVADISGRLSRVTLAQRFRNDYDRAIEAVYTFPLSHRGAVDRMTMTVGDRVVVGSVKRREEARRIYEAARQQGYVASLLEQERSNIFTQSVANIPPGAEVVVEISYVELVESVDGEFAFEFPMVVGPRYVPGSPAVSRALVPAELVLRQGVILRGPAVDVVPGAPGDVDALGSLQPGGLRALLEAAQAVEYPGATPGSSWWGQGEDTTVPAVWYPFEVTYGDGSREIGWIHVDGTGQLNGRWFYTDPKLASVAGAGFALDTNQVPDASRITPMPVRPPKRAGHDISVTVTIDTGGPALRSVDAPLHEITGHEAVGRRVAAPDRLTVRLADRREIPNRDFVLRWRQADDEIETAHFMHTGPNGNFFTVMLQPPARVAPEQVPPRELIFVMDSSGSMNGFPIEKAKAVMTRAIDAMRDGDTFNVITFAGHTSVLWDASRPATEANRAAARAFVEARESSGGTEMMAAIDAALRPTTPKDAEALTLAELADLPADGRSVTVRVPGDAMEVLLQDGAAPSVADLRVRDGLALRARIRRWTSRRGSVVPGRADERTYDMSGRWSTEDGRRVLDVDSAGDAPSDGKAPMRIVMFLTDGYVGNDEAVVAAVAAHAGTTRVFAFGIGNSVNRALLDGMAKAGRGEVEHVLLEDGAEDAVTRFTKRIEMPVLTDIEIVASDGLELADTIPPLDAVPDLFDVKPLVIHGRYAEAGSGTLTIRGRTGDGRWERVVPLELPAVEPEHDVIATLWARAKIDELSPEQDAEAIASLGEQFQIMTKYTSFVAVEHSRVVVEGRAMLVPVPIELPDGVSWEGNFGGAPPDAVVVRDCVFQLDAAGAVVADKATAGLRGLIVDRDARDLSLYAVPTAGEKLVEGKQVLGDTPLVGAVLGEPAAPAMQFGFEAQDLGGAITLLQETSGVPIRVDWPALQAAGIDGREGVSLEPTTARVPVVLNEILGQVGDGTVHPQWTMLDGAYVVSTPEGLQHLLVRAYDVRDLASLPAVALEGSGAPRTGVPDAMSRLAEHIRARLGERGTVVPHPGMLVVTTSEEDQAGVQKLLDELRADPAIAQAREQQRQADRLARVLDEPLQMLERDTTASIPPRAITIDGGLLVSVLAEDAKPETLAALRRAGLNVLDVNAARAHVVGIVPRTRLRDLALSEPVRRVELIRAD